MGVGAISESDLKSSTKLLISPSSLPGSISQPGSHTSLWGAFHSWPQDGGLGFPLLLEEKRSILSLSLPTLQRFFFLFHFSFQNPDSLSPCFGEEGLSWPWEHL